MALYGWPNLIKRITLYDKLKLLVQPQPQARGEGPEVESVSNGQ